jgi:hypothetical protein
MAIPKAVTFRLDPDLLAAVRKYQHAREIKTQTAALSELLKLALRNPKPKAAA